MPTYEYECRGCGHAFEELQSIKAAALRKCPKCGKLKLQRLISGGAGVIFRGSGFYETDYKRARTGGGERKPEGSSGGSSGGERESKPTPSSPPATDAGKGGGRAPPKKGGEE